jgi:eukaryotic-like serine/threonine-protein kinase
VKISKTQWQDLEPLLNRGMEMDADARRAWLDALPETEPSSKPLIPQLRALFAAHDTAERNTQLNTLAKDTISPANPAPVFAESNTVGGYRLVRLIGRGGMGEVWLADQIDGRVQRQVALKLPTRVQHLDVWRKRFDRERDILAKLSHPNIARLYDAGVDQTLARIGLGQPYLALEYVEGVPLSQYADDKQLSINARLRLFRQVLAAVSHAHAHLVIHRDLKPSNVVVTNEGQVKLLDFGIAKLIEPTDTESGEVEDDIVSVDATELTAIGGRAMTLRYAAPEQVDGESVSAVSDVYALGVILYELVAGVSPYAPVQEGKRLTARNMRESEIRSPSVALTKMSLGTSAASPGQDSVAHNRQQRSVPHLARSIAGDIDAIALKALQRDPAQRYTSVAALDEDLQRHLEGSPVRAREGTWRYLLTRFIARNKLPFAAATLVFLAIATGLVMAERERRVALAEKARAEKHFASVRALANTFTFDVYDKLETIAGTLEARQLLVSTSLKYLDSIAAEAADDPKLAVEVATAYRKIAQVKGDFVTTNLGQTRGAQENAARAALLMEKVAAAHPNDIDVLREYREALILQARLTFGQAGSAGVSFGEKALEVAKRMVALPEAQPKDRRFLTSTTGELAHLHAFGGGDKEKAKAYAKDAVDRATADLAEEPNLVVARNNYAAILHRAANVDYYSGDPSRIPNAVKHFEAAIAMQESLVRDFPQNNVYRQTLLKQLLGLTEAQAGVDDYVSAKRNAARALETAEAFYRADAKDATNLMVYLRMLVTSGEIELNMKQYPAALAFVDRLTAELRTVPDTLKTNVYVVDARMVGLHVLATASCALAEDRALDRAKRLALLLTAQRSFAERMEYLNGLIERKGGTARTPDDLKQTIEARDACLTQYQKLKGV